MVAEIEKLSLSSMAWMPNSEEAQRKIEMIEMGEQVTGLVTLGRPGWPIPRTE
jgi:hypothetical protein